MEDLVDRVEKQQQPFYNFAQVGRRLGVGETRARQMAAEGLIPVVHLSPGRRVIPKAAFEAWIEKKNRLALAAVREPRGGA